MLCVYLYCQKTIRFFGYFVLFTLFTFSQVAVSAFEIQEEISSYGLSKLTSLTTKNNQSVLFIQSQSAETFSLNIQFDDIHPLMTEIDDFFESTMEKQNILKLGGFVLANYIDDSQPVLLTELSVISAAEPSPHLWNILLQEEKVKINPFLAPFELLYEFPSVIKQPKQLHLPTVEIFGMIFFGVFVVLAWSRKKRTQRKAIKCAAG
ncbi:hypothetical protein MNBD_GAMMA03-942 [hydrothermal vent metagenome]|uniref:Uncharacterized protein n=1 Tax=hydrothermal vent metagenome TaxID=652676 RepID=A0A3B0VZB2_9ZZZZ